MHPLTPDLTGLSMEDLMAKYNDLTKKYSQAHRTGSWQVMGQMQMIMEDYKNEIDRRQKKILDDVNNKNNNFKNIIDIK